MIGLQKKVFDCLDYMRDIEFLLVEEMAGSEDPEGLRETLRPIIFQAKHSLVELEGKFDRALKEKLYIKDFKSIQDILSRYISNELKGYLIKSSVQKIDQYISVEEVTLAKWDKIIPSLKSMLDVATLFSPQEYLTVNVGKDAMTVDFVVSPDLDFASVDRKFVYFITQSLIKEKMLLTYKAEGGTKGALVLKLRLDYGFDENIFFESAGIKVENVFGDYILSEQLGRDGSADDSTTYLQNFMEMDQTVVMIDKANPKNNQSIPYVISNHRRVNERFGHGDLIEFTDLKERIIYLPFLFRPVSIIIPKRGRYCLGDRPGDELSSFTLPLFDALI